MDVLSEKYYVQCDKLSRYSDIPAYYHKVDNKYMYGISKNLDQSTPYDTYKIKQGDTFDTLALKFYNDPSYYWILADYNRVNDPFAKLKVDTYIRIPVLSSINFERDR